MPHAPVNINTTAGAAALVRLFHRTMCCSGDISPVRHRKRE
jgi:hypothetical protein